MPRSRFYLLKEDHNFANRAGCFPYKAPARNFPLRRLGRLQDLEVDLLEDN